MHRSPSFGLDGTPRRRLLRKTSSCDFVGLSEIAAASVGECTSGASCDPASEIGAFDRSVNARSPRRLRRKTSVPTVPEVSLGSAAESAHPAAFVSPDRASRDAAWPDGELERCLGDAMEMALADEATGYGSRVDVREGLASEPVGRTVATTAPRSEAVGICGQGEEVWRRSTPAFIDRTLCFARTFNKGSGGQCRRKPRGSGEICGSCTKLVHGRVDGPIPDAKLQAFLRASLVP